MSAIDSILTTEQYQTQQANAIYKDGEDGDMLGRDAFLQLFTAQLKNQNPLDPMENEAFVAQLAQFSSVEGIKGMQASLERLVGNLREQSLLTGSTLVGKRVAVAGGFGQGGGSRPTELLSACRMVRHADYECLITKTVSWCSDKTSESWNPASIVSLGLVRTPTEIKCLLTHTKLLPAPSKMGACK